MGALSFIRSFLVLFVVTFVVAGIVSYLYGLIVHGAGQVDWGLAVTLGIILGLILPGMSLLERKKK